MNQRLPIVFSHANGFPAGTYRVLFEAWRAAGHAVHAVEKFGHDPAWPVTSNWPTVFPSGGYMFVGGLVRPDDTQLMFDAARAIAAELASAPVTADELQRATGPASEQILRASSGNVFWMFQTEGATRDPRRFSALRTYISDLTSVTPAELQALAARYLQPERAVPVLILPEDGAAGSGVAAR